jgi:hypothetical protein
MTKPRIWLLAALAVITSACNSSDTITVPGGGGGGGGGGGPTAASISVVSSTPTIPQDGSADATLTAFVRDANNNLLAGVSVVFTATSGGVAGSPAVTDASGSATATLVTAGDPSLRTITVTAAAGALQAQVNVQVVATAGSSTVRMGNGFGAAFQQGMLQLGVTSLSAGGTTGVSASIVDATSNLFTGNVIVTLNSPCVGQGLATITTPITTQTGIANSTYTATGCSGADIITATATVNGTTLTASATVTVASPVVGSIQFISATPTNIGLRGTGGAGRSETSTVIFRVVDATGGPVPNVDVTFALSTSVGGVAVTPAAPTAARTNFDGRVQAVVTSGTIATTVRVTATVVGQSISTQSDQLTITTGIPDQDSVSLSILTLNPEAWALDGVTDAVTIRLSDRFNNPVPDGTAITFTSEGAQIASQCLTTAGACSVNWVSQSPRPTDGRVTLRATATGEESFVDINGNGVFDGGTDTFTDIGEAFTDDNENGTREASEPFLDFGGGVAVAPNGQYDGPNGVFNGLLCNGAGCGAAPTVAVFDLGVIAMSGCDLDPTPFPISVTAPVVVGGLFADMRGNPLPAGTTISFATSNGTLTAPTSFTYPNTLTAQTYGVNVAANLPSSSGALTITVRCPSNVTNVVSITVND